MGTFSRLRNGSPDYMTGMTTVSVTPSGFVLSGPNGVGGTFNTSTGGYDEPLNISRQAGFVGQFRRSATPRTGVTASVPVTTSNSAGTIQTTPLTFTGGGQINDDELHGRQQRGQPQPSQQAYRRVQQPRPVARIAERNRQFGSPSPWPNCLGGKESRDDLECLNQRRSSGLRLQRPQRALCHDFEQRCLEGPTFRNPGWSPAHLR